MIYANTVVQRGVNDHTVMDLLEHVRGSGHIVRLIEFMDVGNSNHWRREQVVPSAEWVRRINEVWPIEPLERTRRSETARRYAYQDGQGDPLENPADIVGQVGNAILGRMEAEVRKLLAAAP